VLLPGAHVQTKKTGFWKEKLREARPDELAKFFPKEVQPRMDKDAHGLSNTTLISVVWLRVIEFAPSNGSCFRGPAQTFHHQTNQRGDTQNQQRCPKVSCTRNRDADAAEQRYIRRDTNGTFGQQHQGGAWQEPPGNLTAPPPARHRTGRVVARPRRNLAAVASLHACAFPAWQHEPAF